MAENQNSIVCCKDGDCCGPGSWCCAHAGKHSHEEEWDYPDGYDRADLLFGGNW